MRLNKIHVITKTDEMNSANVIPTSLPFYS